MDSKTANKTKLPEGFMFENQAKLGQKPNWKMIPIDPVKYPTFAKKK